MRAVDLGDFYKILSDNRDLNYDKYFIKGDKQSIPDAYTSHNTKRLDISETKELLLSLEEVNDLL